MQNTQAQNEQVQNINDLNLAYLMLAQSLIKQDSNAASFRLGLTDSLMEMLKNLSAFQLMKLASTNQLICQLRISSEAVIDCLTKDSRIDALQRLHTGIILSTDLLHSLSDAQVAG
jgi:flagellar transcriptional activator FlhD